MSAERPGQYQNRQYAKLLPPWGSYRPSLVKKGRPPWATIWHCLFGSAVKDKAVFFVRDGVKKIESHPSVNEFQTRPCKISRHSPSARNERSFRDSFFVWKIFGILGPHSNSKILKVLLISGWLNWRFWTMVRFRWRQNQNQRYCQSAQKLWWGHRISRKSLHSSKGGRQGKQNAQKNSRCSRWNSR